MNVLLRNSIQRSEKKSILRSKPPVRAASMTWKKCSRCRQRKGWCPCHAKYFFRLRRFHFQCNLLSESGRHLIFRCPQYFHEGSSLSEVCRRRSLCGTAGCWYGCHTGQRAGNQSVRNLPQMVYRTGKQHYLLRRLQLSAGQPNRLKTEMRHALFWNMP